MSGRILDDGALEDVFRRRIRPVLRGSRPTGPKTALLVTGQEASGKTSVMQPFAASLGLAGACRFEADDLFAAHPEFAGGNDEELLDDINYLTYLAESEISEQGWDLVTSQPCYSEQLAVGELEYHRAHDYRVVAAVVATHPAESLLSAADRYYNHGGRWITAEDHATSVEALPRVVRAIAQSDACAGLHLVTRHNAVPGPDFRGSPDAAEQELKRFQDRPWTAEQVERFQQIRAPLPPGAELVREIDRLAEPKLTEFYAARQHQVAQAAGISTAVRASGLTDSPRAPSTPPDTRARPVWKSIRSPWRGRDQGDQR
ncbi:zeta toxin family protein [Kribbella pratensis]|uniref:UDP-N-acetylglucosamine kinase n=1 Tax=Kribbella pratensis TaxID=2512112 RepID=A0A4R8C3M0_9ACTN|nr:zeta toxin family protein [Kribbella pratensis]TDW69681.1 zeta toxin [Kribbella pratensis]